MMKRFLLLAVGILYIQSLFAVIPAGYYDGATGSGYTLKTQLYNIIHTHTERDYGDLWTDFQSTDKKANGYVWDMYSDKPSGTPDYDFTFITEQCGNYSGEGDCYNREHSFPKSWFNDATPMYTDLFHLYPTDGYVNGKRSNYPFGEVGTATWTSTNGSKLGTSNFLGYSGTVFEPIDEYKGDFARGYFYMVTCYENVITTWPGSDMLDGTSDHCFTDWALSMLIQWSNEDPVSQKEIDRNDAVYAIQHNRNPYIDHPEYIAQIWGGSGNMLPSISGIAINPASPTSSDAVSISATITDYDGTISSAELHWGLSSGSLTSTISMSVTSGSTYETNTDIPAQANGATVYYEISATDNDAGNKTTPVQSYTVNDGGGSTGELLNEDFASCTGTGWMTYSVAGSANWTCGSGYESVNAYGADAASNDWLISPAQDLDSYDNEVLSFKSWTKYTDTYNPPIYLKYSTNYSGSGDPTSATWHDLNPTWSAQNSEVWTESGNIDISGIAGNQVYFAFQYISSGTGANSCAQWEIDDVIITGDAGGSTNVAPEITNITNSPDSPTENDDITVSATITDSDGTISSAKINWGTSSGSYPNTVTMTNSESTYSGVISKQAAGVKVYYKIEATDNDAETTLSSENSFLIVSSTNNELPVISNVVLSPENPTSSDNVLVSAMATDADGSVQTVVLKWKIGEGTNTEIGMNLSGDKYYAQIPKQATGSIVNFTILATDNDNAESSYEDSYTVSQSSGIGDMNFEKDLQLYPNPVKEYLNIQLDNYSGEIELKIYDVIGIPVYSQKIEFQNQHRISIDNLDSGLYLVSFVIDNTLITKRIVVKK